MHFEDGVEGGNSVACGGEDDEIFDACHDLGGGHVGNSHLFAVIDEWVFVEMDPGFVDAAAGEGVADPFGDHDAHHDGEDICQGTGEFEHDDHDGDGHASHSRQGCCCADDGVRSWRDAGDVWCAALEEEEAAVVVDPDLHDDTDGAADERTNRHGGENDTRGDLETECDGGEEEAECGGKDEQDDGAGGRGALVAQADLVVFELGAFDE